MVSRRLDPWRGQWGKIQDDALRSRNVLQFYAHKILSPRHPAATIEITDGSKDGGLDAFLIDDRHKRVVLLQCQWFDKEGEVLSKTDARKLLSFYNDHLTKDNDAGLKQDVSKFVKRWNSFLKGYRTSMAFITNGEMKPADSAAYPDDSLTVVDSETMETEFYETLGELERPSNKVEFDLQRGKFFEWEVPSGHVRVLQCAVNGQDLKLAYDQYGDGLLVRNLRLSLGGRINEDISDTVTESPTRDLFYLYHNGISIICQKMTLTGASGEHPHITLKNASIVNGGQSTVTLARLDKTLVKQVFLPCKITETLSAEISKGIAVSNNTQNPMDAFGWIANDPEIVFLQNFAATMIDPPVFLQRRKGSEKWNHVPFASGLPAPPGLRKTSYKDAAQGFLAFMGNPTKAYSSPKAYITPPNACYLQIVGYHDPRLIILAGLLTNYERELHHFGDSFTKYWKTWVIAAMGHLYNYHYDPPAKVAFVEHLLSNDGQEEYQRALRPTLKSLFENIFKKYYTGLNFTEDYLMQGFFKGQEEVFSVDSVKGIKMDDIKSYVSGTDTSFGKLKAAQQINFGTYDVNFAVFAAAMDKELKNRKNILKALSSF